MIVKLLKGEKINSIPPKYPAQNENVAYINKKQAKEFGITIPSHLSSLRVVE